MKAWAHSSKRHGFTIVELLIVIVVIAILAAITIVAYNGIQNRAKDTSLQTAAAQAGKKVLAFGPTNSDLFPEETVFASPTSLAASSLNLPAPTDATTYSYYTTADRKAFCLSVTNTTVSPAPSYAFTQNGQTVQGRCVKNLMTNPSVEGSTTSYGGSCVTPSLSSDWRVSGTTSLRQVPISTTTNDCSSPAGGDTGALRLGMQPGRSYRASGTVRIPAVQSVSSAARSIRVYYRTATVSYVASQSAQAANQIGAGRVDVLLNLPSDATEAFIRLYNGTMSGGGDTFWDAIMLTEGTDLYAYGDGTSDNWSWVGTPHASASFGPSLVQ